MSHTKVMPMLTLRGKIVFPHTAIYFDVSRKRSIHALEEAMNEDQMIFLTGQQDPNQDNPKREDIYEVGTIARIKQLVKLPKGLVRVLAEGVSRGKILELCETEPAFRVEVLVEESDQNQLDVREQEAFLQSLGDILDTYAEENPKLNENLLEQLKSMTDLEVLIDEVTTNMPFHFVQKQIILEEMDLRERAEKLLIMLNEEIEILRIRKELQGKVKESVDKGQKDYILR